MKTEKEIKESIEWLQKQLDISLDPVALIKELAGTGMMLSAEGVVTYIASCASKKEALEWVLE